MAFKEVDPLTGKKRRSGGRQKGTPNRTTTARYAAMDSVNQALAAIGDDPLSGMRLLKEVLNHKDAPLDVKIQCAGLLTKYELPTIENKAYVAHMPMEIPAEDQRQKLAIWWALHGGTDDPEIVAEAEKFLTLVAAKDYRGGPPNEQQRLPNYHRPTRPHLLVELHSKRPTPRSISRIYHAHRVC
jgi:hypothetical protein